MQGIQSKYNAYILKWNIFKYLVSYCKMLSFCVILTVYVVIFTKLLISFYYLFQRFNKSNKLFHVYAVYASII